LGGERRAFPPFPSPPQSGKGVKRNGKGGEGQGGREGEGRVG